MWVQFRLFNNFQLSRHIITAVVGLNPIHAAGGGGGGSFPTEFKYSLVTKFQFLRLLRRGIFKFGEATTKGNNFFFLVHNISSVLDSINGSFLVHASLIFSFVHLNII
jgi:hypothetical protein